MRKGEYSFMARFWGLGYDGSIARGKGSLDSRLEFEGVIRCDTKWFLFFRDDTKIVFDLLFSVKILGLDLLASCSSYLNYVNSLNHLNHRTIPII